MLCILIRVISYIFSLQLMLFSTSTTLWEKNFHWNLNFDMFHLYYSKFVNLKLPLLSYF